MLCESCKINESKYCHENASVGYHLCTQCQHRLINYALRPLEYFNLCAIYGHNYYLHDDFYESDTGEATQPKIEVKDAEDFPFPMLQDIKYNLQTLVNYACVQYFTSDDVVEKLKDFDNQAVLKELDRKVKYNKVISSKIYEIAGKVLGGAAYNWLKNEWENLGTENLLIFAEPISQCFSANEAFSILSSTIELGPDKEFAENSLSLVYLKSEMTLDWIEDNQFRINIVSQNWGIIAAASRFSWRRAEKWLAIGRPLSLIALDALSYCTAKGERQNQPLRFQKNKRYLLDEVKPEVIACKLADYLANDNVPRTKNSIKKIINNLLDTTL